MSTDAIYLTPTMLREMELFKAVTNGTHHEWEQMVDTRVVDNNVAMALAMKILTQCVENVVDKGTFDKPLQIQGAEPGAGGIYAIAWMKLKDEVLMCAHPQSNFFS